MGTNHRTLFWPYFDMRCLGHGQGRTGAEDKRSGHGHDGQAHPLPAHVRRPRTTTSHTATNCSPTPTHLARSPFPHPHSLHGSMSTPTPPHLARDDVPLLGGGDDHLRLRQLPLGQLHVARQLADQQAWGRGQGRKRVGVGACVTEPLQSKGGHVARDKRWWPGV